MKLLLIVALISICNLNVLSLVLQTSTSQYRVKTFLMVVGDTTEDYEAMVPFQTLKTLGHQIDTVSPNKLPGDTIQTVIDDGEPGWQTFSEKLGHRFPITKDLRQVQMKDYDALLIPGGRSPEHLQLNEIVIQLVRDAVAQDKVLASICHGPLILAASGVLKGKQCTAYEGIRPQVELGGCEFQKVTDNEAVVDGRLITATTWAAIPAWLRAILREV